jgi:imidazolonepropionase-like amidohydrolase
MRNIFKLLFLLFAFQAAGQYEHKDNNVADRRPERVAFINATIMVSPGKRIDKGMMLIEKGRIVAVSSMIAIPKGYTVVDLNGYYLYPSFIELNSNYGLPEVKDNRPPSNTPQYQNERSGPYAWNEALKSEYQAHLEFGYDAKLSGEMRGNGFGLVLTHRRDGVARGTGALVSLGNGAHRDLVLLPDAGAFFSFNKGTSRQSYPNSLMGSVALLRQAWHDCQWYTDGGKEMGYNATLEALSKQQSLPYFFDSGHKLRSLLADQIGDEFGKQVIIFGSGDEYQRALEIKATRATLVLPLNFPDAYEVEDPFAALEVSLSQMKHWELAPSNAQIMFQNAIPFALTTNGLDAKKFWEKLRKAIERGLPASEALAALTTIPAKSIGMQDKIGSLESGKMAYFLIASGDLFEGEGNILENWTPTDRIIVKKWTNDPWNGEYDLKLDGKIWKMTVKGYPEKASVKVLDGDSTLKSSFSIDGKNITLSFQPQNGGEYRLSGWLDEAGITGNAKHSSGATHKWSAAKTNFKDEPKAPRKEEKQEELGPIIYPFVAHGWMEKPLAENIVIRNATVWTLEGEGKLEQADVWIRDGKIAGVGKNLAATGATEIDGTGMHISPGIIDEHSHIALLSVNEGSMNSSAEVRMYDAVNSEDINIYRQLAGGVTAAQLLHGSANPIGGQSALIKLRWGSAPMHMRIEGADGFIKFALGENVKQSNWGSNNTIRFPQTRMGVEQVYVNSFTRAKEYDALLKNANTGKKKKAVATVPIRRDLELEALAQILNSERFISCHSYVQSEINMLMKVAEDFDFRINTFTHILEGYKVADKMAAHGVGASTFSDWWAYKYEVKEAIPYNAALMTMAGVTTAINSDDPEMGRRLNQEAAKGITYGGMDEIEALKMVTLNPAILLHLDDRMGSIKVGKDADLVLWTDHPLSIYARVQCTWVDGIRYYDLERDRQMQQWIQVERQRLINKMRKVKAEGGDTQPPTPEDEHHWHCDDLTDF